MTMRDYQYDHVHLRSPDPDATARFFETMFGAEVTRSVYLRWTPIVRQPEPLLKV
jgi:catechol 2,3-dioxygenase-like lactoylglutathione lyase family enzyme